MLGLAEAQLVRSGHANRADPQVRTPCLVLFFVAGVCSERRAMSRRHMSRRRCRVHLAAASLAQSHLCCSTSRSAPKSNNSTVGCPKLDFPPNGPQRVSGEFSHVCAAESACECCLVQANGKEEEGMAIFRGVFFVLCLEICQLEGNVRGRNGRRAGHLAQTHPPTHPPGLVKHMNATQMCGPLKVDVRILSDLSEKAPV